MIDAAARPDLCGGIEQLARAMQDNHTAIDWNKLDRYLVEWGGGSVAKRLGYLAEALTIPLPAEILDHWQGLATKGISLLEPGLERNGPVITRWRLQVNVDL